MAGEQRVRGVGHRRDALGVGMHRVKRAAFGFTSFRNYRIRSPLSAGKPNWDLPGLGHTRLKSVVPACGDAETTSPPRRSAMSLTVGISAYWPKRRSAATRG